MIHTDQPTLFIPYGNVFPWYARLSFKDRIQYLDRMIAMREAEHHAWLEQQIKIHTDPDELNLARLILSKPGKMAWELKAQRQIKLEDHDPLNTMRMWRGTGFELIDLPPRSRDQLYRVHLDSRRWQRIRTRKMTSVSWRCEYQGCAAAADECHHLHYNRVGVEENSDLEALCSRHHRARHGWMV